MFVSLIVAILWAPILATVMPIPPGHTMCMENTFLPDHRSHAIVIGVETMEDVAAAAVVIESISLTSIKFDIVLIVTHIIYEKAQGAIRRLGEHAIIMAVDTSLTMDLFGMSILLVEYRKVAYIGIDILFTKSDP